MPISPELRVTPGIIYKFVKSGVAGEIISSWRNGDERNLIEDAKKILPEFKKEHVIYVKGLENVNSACIFSFNHPNNDILIPAFFEIAIKLNEKLGIKINFPMASEYMLFAKLNDKKEFPGSIKFMESFHKIYRENIISTPTVKGRKDYLQKRAVALRKIFKSLESGNILAIAPEGHVEIDEIVSPPESYHEGSGAIARFAAKKGIPTISAGIWREKKQIFINVGEPFIMSEETDKDAAIDLMKHIAELMPQNLRGPFA